jgi:large subunit ribosomal protein L4
MKLKVYSTDGASHAEKDFSLDKETEFAEGDKGVALLKQTVIAYRSNQRQGNAKTKDYGEVAGSGKKILRQKGSGGSRHGDKRAPQLYKGGVVFGPRPRDWSKGITAKAKKLALARALFELARDGGLSVIERFEVAAPKTKLFNAILEKVVPGEKRVLVVDIAWDENVFRAFGNIARLCATDAASVNALDLVEFQQVLVTEQGLAKILERANG